MKTIEHQDVAVAHPDRIQVRSPGNALSFSPTPPPSLLTVFARETWKRKSLLGVWVAATIVLTAFVVLVFAKPLYRAEGRMAYRPNYSRGSKPVYTPPNIQSAVQVLKSNEVLNPVREKHVPEMSADEFAKKVRIEVSKQSEFIDVGFDHPNPAVAAAVANDLMTTGLKYFNDVRIQNTKAAAVQVANDLKSSRRQLEVAKEEYRKAFASRGISDPDLELETARSGLTDVEVQLRAARQKQAELKLEIKFLEARRDAPADASDTTFDESFFPVMTAMMNELQTKMVNQQTLETARIKLESARREEEQTRPLMMKQIVPRNEYEKIVTEIRTNEAILKQAEEVKQLREELQKKYDDLRKKSVGNKPVRRNVIEELQRLQKDEATIPATLAVLDQEHKARKQTIANLVALKRELGEKDDNIKLIWNRVQDFHSQLTDASERSQDLNANDLRIHEPAEAGATPYSSSGPKLGMALVGASALLFVGYIAMFALPLLTSPANGATGAVASRLPRGLVALVPYIQTPRPKPGDPASPLAPGALAPRSKQPVVQALANRIAQEGVDDGGLVLFAPTEEQLLVTSVIGDLGEEFTRRGEKVLVFDARQLAETPDWAGPTAPGVTNHVENYLDGQSESPAECFVPTNLPGVEYARADVASRVSGVMAAHRLRQLVEQMRDRYSLVFFVTPPVTFDSEPLLATLAEGMVLVTETDANPVEIHAYLDTLCQQVPARLYGTLSVPKA